MAEWATVRIDERVVYNMYLCSVLCSSSYKMANPKYPFDRGYEKPFPFYLPVHLLQLFSLLQLPLNLSSNGHNVV